MLDYSLLFVNQKNTFSATTVIRATVGGLYRDVVRENVRLDFEEGFPFSLVVGLFCTLLQQERIGL